jgi:acyl carrier protein
MGEEEIEREVQALCDRRGLALHVDRSTRLADVGLRSLDVSELAIRVEERLGRELNVGAAVLRRLDTVDDLVQYLRSAVEAS